MKIIFITFLFFCTKLRIIFSIRSIIPKNISFKLNIIVQIRGGLLFDLGKFLKNKLKIKNAKKSNEL